MESPYDSCRRQRDDDPLRQPESAPEPGNELKKLGKSIVGLAVTLWTIGLSVLALEWLPPAVADAIKIGMNVMVLVGLAGAIVWLLGHFRGTSRK